MASLPRVPIVKLGSQGLEVSTQGLGCMGMTKFHGPGPSKPENEMIDLIRYAHSCGITYFDTGDLYGPYINEILLGKAIKGIREMVQVGTKFGAYFDNEGGKVRGDPEYVRESCEGSLKRLGTDYIDLYFYNRADTRVPIEITMGELKKLVEEGKVRYLGLSEMSASTIRRAHAVHPITAIQVEWSLWSREIEIEIVPTCRELGIGIVAYSPLGRGFLSTGAKLLDNLPKEDLRKVQPRLQGVNLEKNQVLYEHLLRLASKKGCTPGQLALAWVQHQGSFVMPIPGTTKAKNLEENLGALSVKLSKEEMAEMEDLFPLDAAAGGRYPEFVLKMSYQETPPLVAK